MKLDYTPFILSLQLALVTTGVLAVLSLPLVFVLHFYRFRLRPVIKALISLPLVLPPTVLGYYLLVAFRPEGLLAQIAGVQLAFSFTGLVLGSIIYSLPFMVQPLQSGFQGLSNSLREAAQLMGKSRRETLIRVLLPNMKASVLTGIVLSFAHTVGEFGVVLMIGGSIPGQTKVASIAIYEQVEAMNYEAANLYSGVLFTITFLILLLVYVVNGQFLKRRGI